MQRFFWAKQAKITEKSLIYPKSFGLDLIKKQIGKFYSWLDKIRNKKLK